jgi:AraC-like DNA-binding protein
VDDLASEARQWDLDFRQLVSGKFRGQVLQFGTTGVHISDARFGLSLLQKGSPPAGTRTIAIPANRDLQLEWRGKRIDGSSLMIFPRGSELSSVSGPDFHVYTCSFPEELLAAAGETLELGWLDEVSGGADAIRAEPVALRELRACLAEICQRVISDPAFLSSEALTKRLCCELPGRIMQVVAHAQGECPPAYSGKRLAAIDRAEAYIEQHAFEKIGVGDICRAADVCERTLQYAFLERYGIGPKEFLNAFRLQAARRELRAANPHKTRVAEVANAWGFWHLGQFAADYRRRFEELPSETLRSHSDAGD